MGLVNIFQDIASAIRNKTKNSYSYKPDDMANAINNMETIDILAGLPSTSSEGVIGYIGTLYSIPNKVVHSEYGNINVVYDYIGINNGNISQIFEVTDASNLFASNTNNVMNFDVIKIGNNVTNMAYTFSDCTDFNQPIVIGHNVTYMLSTFNKCYNFNQPITIPDKVTDMYYTFRNCYNFNQPITIPDNVTNMSWTFVNCRNFNQPISIGNNVTFMHSTFHFCTNFNQPITIPNSVTDMYDTFRYCSNFNQPITIGNNVTYMCNTFCGCNSFNQPITIPNRVFDMSWAFGNCRNFNQPITIPDKVTNMDSTFSDCSNFGSSIYFKNSSKLTSNNTQYMFYNCNNSLRKNIYCNNATPFIQYTNTYSIVGAYVTWDTMSDGNGYYNATYNIYIYNNYTG